MKNLKKLSVVLFATLLSFNFTSCIDDGVSDAVDQVYLAQAEFLKAQAALKEADAQLQIAKAATEAANAQFILAQAEVELAYARETDAYTAQVEADTETILIANLYSQANNAILLEEAQALSDKAVQVAELAMIEAMATHQATMVTLTEAIVGANDAVVLGLYAKYQVEISKLEVLMAAEVTAMKNLATANLFLNAPDNTITQAYYIADQEAQLADKLALEATYNATIAMYEGEIAALEAAQPSDIQVQVSALEAKIDSIDNAADLLQVARTEQDIVVSTAWLAWQAANEEYTVIFDKQAEVSAMKALIKGHEDDMAQDTMDIADIQEVIDVDIPAAEAAAAAAVVNYSAAIAALEAAEAALGTQSDLWWPSYDDDKIDPAVTLHDVWFNAAIDEEIADKALSDAYGAVNDLWNVGIEFDLAAAEAALASYVPGTPIADLEAAVVAANAEEEAAQEAYELDPDGLTIDAGDDGVAGENQATTGQTWVQIISYGLSGPTFGTTTYDSFASVQLGEDDPIGPPIVVSVAVDNNETGDGGDTAPFGVDVWEVVAGIDGTMVGQWFNVEADDTDQPNVDRLWDARYEAYLAQSNLDIELNGISGVTEDRDLLLEEVKAAYLALGYVWGDAIFGTPDYNDIDSVTDYIDNLETAATDANTAENEAEDDVTEAEAAIGSPFAEFDSPADWLDLGSNDSVDASDLNDNDPNTLYEEVENALINWSIALQEIAALGTVEANEALIEAEWTEIAEIAALLPSHEYALAFLEGELQALLDASGLDLDSPLWENDDDHSDLLNGTVTDEGWWVEWLTSDEMHDYLPLYAAYLDARSDRDLIDAQIDALAPLRYHAQWLAASLHDNLGGDDYDVAAFEAAIQLEIETIEALIVGVQASIDALPLAIEKLEVIIAKGYASHDDMVAQVSQKEALLANIQSQMGLVESAAASLLARINAAMAN